MSMGISYAGPILYALLLVAAYGLGFLTGRLWKD